MSTPSILITGASSYVGARVYFDLQRTCKLTGTYYTNPLSQAFLRLDLTDKNAVERMFLKTKPDVVVHVANFSSPRNAVNNIDRFTALNATATTHVVDAADAIGAKVVFISSQAANNPDNIYGQLKVQSETCVRSAKAGYLILRPSLLVGMSPNTTNPRPFNRILHCLNNQNVVGEFDTSWTLQPSYVGHLAQVIARTITQNSWNETIPVFLNEPVTQYQIAKDLLSHFGMSVKAVDQHISIPLSSDDLREFNALNLAPHTYRKMIQTIVEEIRAREKFRL